MTTTTFLPPAEVSALSRPLYGATFGGAASRFFRKYATFSGRASLSEYWKWVLVNLVITSVLAAPYVLAFAAPEIAYSLFGWLPVPPGLATVVGVAAWSLATFLPSIALTIRRMHDANLPGALYLVILVPLIGSLALLIFTLLGSNPAGARFDRS